MNETTGLPIPPPPPPSAYDVTLTDLTDKEVRYLWHDARVKWAIAKQIIDLRSLRGWTQKELARRSGLWQPQIVRLERGKGSPTVRTLVRIAAAFDCAFVCRFASWSEWLNWQQTLESGSDVPMSFEEEDKLRSLKKEEVVP